MSYLESLFTKYGTDKGHLGGSGWGYTSHYEGVVGKRRFRVKRVLEIGICGYRDIPNNVVGASLFVWRAFFPNAEIYGVDIDSRFVFNDQVRIHTAQCDAYDPDALHEALVQFGGQPFDMIVDDAVHDPVPQAALMNQLGSWLIPGGAYFMEDVGPEKVGGDLSRLIDGIMGFSAIEIGHLPTKPEVLVIGVK